MRKNIKYLRKAVIIFCFLILLTPFKNSALAIPSLSGQPFGMTVPIEKSQIEIQIQGTTITDNNIPLPIGTIVYYAIQGQSYSSIYPEFIKQGNFVIDNDKGNYKIKETITVMTGDNVYYKIGEVKLPNDYVIGKTHIILKDNNYLFSFSEISGNTITKDISFYGTLSAFTPNIIKTMNDNITVSTTTEIKAVIKDIIKEKTIVAKNFKEKNASSSIKVATSSINIENTNTTTTSKQKSFWLKIKNWFSF